MRLCCHQKVLWGSLGIEMLGGSCTRHVQYPAQEAQVDSLKLFKAGVRHQGHPDLTAIRQHRLDHCIIELAPELGVHDPQLSTARLQSKQCSLGSALKALNSTSEGPILMHDQPQVLTPVNLLHSLPSKHEIGLVCPLIEDNSLSLCQVDCQASVLTEGMQSIELGLETTFRLGDKDQVVGKEQQQNHLP